MSAEMTAALVADTIRRQVGTMIFATLGASNLAYFTDEWGAPGLRFRARILPFNRRGERGSAPRVMDVEVTLNGADLYDLNVTYATRGVVTEHYVASGLDAYMLRATLFSLDYDGPTVLNPRTR